jgi:hypothetical protein
MLDWPGCGKFPQNYDPAKFGNRFISEKGSPSETHTLKLCTSPLNSLRQIQEGIFQEETDFSEASDFKARRSCGHKLVPVYSAGIFIPARFPNRFFSAKASGSLSLENTVFLSILINFGDKRFLLFARCSEQPGKQREQGPTRTKRILGWILPVFQNQLF